MAQKILGLFSLCLLVTAPLACEAPNRPRRTLFNFDGLDVSPHETYVSDKGLTGNDATYKVPERRQLYYYESAHTGFDQSHFDPVYGPSHSSGTFYNYVEYPSPYYLEKSNEQSLPERDASLDFDVQASQVFVPATGGAVWVRARVTAPSFVNRRQGGLNLAVLLDVSESMQDPAKLGLTKALATAIVRQLLPSDFISLIAFDGRAHVLVPAERASDQTVLLREIDRLETGSGTNLGAGLFEAYAQVEDAERRGGGTGHVVLVSDGLETGVGNGWRVEDLARQKHAVGVRLSVVGVGQTMDAGRLADLADAGEGRFVYVVDERAADKTVATVMQSMLKAFATNVRVQVQGGAKILAVHGVGSRAPGRQADLVLADFASGEERSLLLRLRIPPLGADGKIDVTFKLFFRQVSPVRRTIFERNLVFEASEESGGGDPSVESYARLITGFDQIRRALESRQAVHVETVVEILEKEFPALKATALAEGDGELIEQAAFFEEFAGRLRVLSARPGGLSEGGPDLEALRRDFYFRR